MMRPEPSMQRGGFSQIRRLTAIMHRVHRRLQQLSYDYVVGSEWACTWLESVMQREQQHLVRQPLISVRMRVSTATVTARQLRRAVESVLAQQYPHWQLCIDVDVSATPVVLKELMRYQELNPRVIVGPGAGDVVMAAWSPVSATETFIVWLQPHDALARGALYWVVQAISVNPGLQLLYGDEDGLGRLVAACNRGSSLPGARTCCAATTTSGGRGSCTLISGTG